MTATTLDGKATAAAIKAELAERVAKLADQGVRPGLGTVLVGEDPGSQVYVAGKHRDCAEVGIGSIRVDLPADVSQATVEAAVHELNEDPACTGYLVQLPLPAGLDANALLELMDPAKDADGLHPVNLGRLVLGVPAPLPCTPRAIVELLRRYDVPIAGADVVVVGRGITVGRALGLLLTRKSENATVTSCHTGTRDLAAHLRRADILVAAAGRPDLVTADLVKPGAAVLDVGVTRTEAGLRGDVAAEVREVAGFLAPNPGGVGPMTRAMLLTNVVEAAEGGHGLTVAADRSGPRAALAQEWPILLVLAVVGVALAIVLTGAYRHGCVVLAGAVVLAFFLRLLLPRREIGMLAVRSRTVDLVVLGALAGSVSVLAFLVPAA